MDALGLFSSGLFQGMNIVWSGFLTAGESESTSTTNNSKIVIITSAKVENNSGNFISNGICIVYAGNSGAINLYELYSTNSSKMTQTATIRVALSETYMLTLSTRDSAIACFGIA